jgi:hypothetical protein
MRKNLIQTEDTNKMIKQFLKSYSMLHIHFISFEDFKVCFEQLLIYYFSQCSFYNDLML